MLAKVSFGLNRAQVWGGIGVAALLVLLACEAREPMTPESAEWEVVEVEPGMDLEAGLDQGAALRSALARDNVFSCTQYFVDGQLVGEDGVGGWSAARLNELDIESIEVVKGSGVASLSVRYPEVRSGCGVILVFTRGGKGEEASHGKWELVEVPPAGAALAEGRDYELFTPSLVRPEIRNRKEVEALLVQSYPAFLREAGIGGTANVSFRIDETGKVVEYEIFKSSGYEAFDEAALRVAGGMEFTPALNGDRPVPTQIVLPISFRTY